jgi:hypothetical protein
MWTYTFGILIAVSLFASAQDRTIVGLPLTSSHSSRDIAVPQMEQGTVQGRTYTNASIGLELTAAPGLIFNPPELKGTPGTTPLLVTAGAWGESSLFSARSGTIFYSDALAYYPAGQRSTDAYMRKVIRGNEHEGFEIVEKNLQASVGDITFARTDFKKNPVYEAVLVKSCDTQAMVFIFAAADRDAVDRLIAGTDLKLDGLRSGCRGARTTSK